MLNLSSFLIELNEAIKMNPLNDQLDLMKLLSMSHSEIRLFIENIAEDGANDVKNKVFEDLVEKRQSYIEHWIELKPFESVDICPVVSRIEQFSATFGQIKASCLISITGESNTGKSMIVTSIAIDCAIKTDRQILFIDSDSSLTSDRINLFCKMSENEKLAKMKIYHIFKIDQFYDFLEHITNNQSLHKSILIIDSLNCFMWQSMIDKTSSKELNFEKLSHTLRSVTNRCNLTTIITKLFTNRYDYIFKNVDIQIMLKNNDHNGNIMASISTKNTWPFSESKFNLSMTDLIVNHCD